MRILVVDVGGSHVKILATGERRVRRFDSGPAMTAKQMAMSVMELAKGWEYDAVTIGYPGPVLNDQPASEPHNLGPGWKGFDYAKAFARPVKMINDAAMQALGSYRGGKMLFLGLGTGLGSTLIIDGVIEAMELGHLPYGKKTYEHFVGQRGLDKLGTKKWRKAVSEVTELFIAALLPEYVVIGGGNAKRLKALPENCSAGNNAAAFAGGFRLWSGDAAVRKRRAAPKADAKDPPRADPTTTKSAGLRRAAPSAAKRIPREPAQDRPERPARRRGG